MEENDKMLDEMFKEKKDEKAEFGKRLYKEIEQMYEPEIVPVVPHDMDPPDSFASFEPKVYHDGPHPTDVEKALLKAPDYTRFGIEFDNDEDEEWLAKEEDEALTFKDKTPLSEEAEDILACIADDAREFMEDEAVSFMVEKHDNTGSGINMIAVARKFMWHMLTEYNDGSGTGYDAGGSFYDGYRANVAMLIYDNVLTPSARDRLSDEALADLLNRSRQTAELILGRVFD